MFMNPRAPSLAACWLIAFPIAAPAQVGEAVLDVTAPPVAQAARRDGPVGIDGRLNEAAWDHARSITDFRQYEPNEGAPASLRTELRVLYDDQALYIGARMAQPQGVVAPLARRDQLLDASGNNGSFNSLTTDKLVVSLDPYHNHLDNVLFEVNPAGVRGDQFNGDPSWDPIWEAAAQADSLGWTAEMRIPLSQLRFAADSNQQTWGLQVWRYIDRLNERDMWSFWSQSAAGGPAFFGDLSGLAIAAQPRQLEVLPYLVTGSTFRDVDARDPYQSSPDLRLGLGADVKYLLTSSLTLDGTLNPDFGQVEVDPATLNLTAYETFYEEKRPFFIAGASAFRFGGGRCMFCTDNAGLGAFYSRRIGRAPQLAGTLSQLGTYADPPENTAILAAAKITGRTQSGYTVGLLNAVTNQESARYLTAGGDEETQVVEPFTNYFVGRTKKEFRGGASTLGGIVTSTIRQTSDPLVSDRLRSHAEAVGVDWYHSWNRRNYSWMGTTLFSNVGGSPEAIDRTLRSSAHYFQRPDRQVTSDGPFDTRYRPGSTSLRGYGLATRVGKDGGGVLRWEAMTNIRSPGLEMNDLAFLNRGDYMWFNGNVGGNWTTPTGWYRSIFSSVGGSSRFNFDGDRLGSTVQAFYGMEFLNYWNLRLFVIHEPAAYDDQLTRGGPVVGRPAFTVSNVGISTDARAPIVFDLQVQAGRGATEGTRSLTLRPGMALKPAPNIFIQLSPNYFYQEDVAQYVATISDPTAEPFFGNRYVFAFLQRKTLSLETRLNATFTPDLTLQLYAQPFLASGKYSSFREFAAPRTAEKVVYGRDIGTIGHDAAAARYHIDPDAAGPARPFTVADPDFTARSLRGTAVLRWEYRPGSTLFFVWTQERAGYDRFDSFDLGAARSLLLDDRATNVFRIKATYWIG